MIFSIDERRYSHRLPKFVDKVTRAIEPNLIGDIRDRRFWLLKQGKRFLNPIIRDVVDGSGL